MKVSISCPPIQSRKGTPLLSQNRQFQWFNSPTHIYPMVPAYAATLLDRAGFDVLWDDGIAEEKPYRSWLADFDSKNTNVMMIETKTPVVKKHWRIIDDIKEVSPETKIVLVGDHVTALPRESMKNSKVDYILTGGDYDFLLLNLCEHLEEGKELEPGVWYRENNKIKSTGKFEQDHDLNSLPFLDRDLTNWQLYSKNNGNYKKLPGTYTMVGRDCWWRRRGGCTFCSWTTLYPKFRTRRPKSLADEIGCLIRRYGVKTIFDDTGTFPVGEWLREFCRLMIENGYNQQIDFSCNMRFGACSLDDYKLMKKAGFRMLLFGLESASQKTLNRVNKGLTVKQVISSCKKAKEAGLEPHLTIMVGYPWETEKEAWKTFKLAKMLFEEDWADTLQVTIVVPYPGTKLFENCKRDDMLKTLDWDDYDMRKVVMKSEITQGDVKEMTRRIYKLYFGPKYLLNRIASIRSLEDLRFIERGAGKVLGHLSDFGD